MIVTNDVRTYSIPFNFLLETYKIPKTELLKILIIRRNIRYEIDDNNNKIFFLNGNDLDFLQEISKFKANIEKFNKIHSSLLGFLLNCRGYSINKIPLITLQEFEDYTEYLAEFCTAFYGAYSEILLIDNYKKIIKENEYKIREFEYIIKELEDKISKTEKSIKYEELKNRL